MIDAEPTPTVGGGLPEEGPTVSLREFGELLKQLREHAGLTQERAATALGVSRPTFAQWEGGRHLPAEDRVARLDELLNGLGRLIEAAAQARGPQRLRPVVAGDTPVGPVHRPLLRVFDDVRRALLDQLCLDDEGHPLGWRRNLIGSDRPPSVLSTGYGLKTLAILGGLDPRTTALVGRVFDLAVRDSDRRVIGWMASTSAEPRIETTAIVYEALQRVGADLGVDEVVRNLRAQFDDTARGRPLILSTALDAVTRIAPDSDLTAELVAALLACRVDFGGVLLWPEKRVDRPQPLLEPSVAHTARAINALRSAPDQVSREAVAIAESWIAETDNLGGVSEIISRRPAEGGIPDDLAFHTFTAAHVVRALAGSVSPSRAHIDRALGFVWARYDEERHLWAWGNGDVPVWMVMDAVDALNYAAIALMPTPVLDSG